MFEVQAFSGKLQKYRNIMGVGPTDPLAASIRPGSGAAKG